MNYCGLGSIFGIALVAVAGNTKPTSAGLTLPIHLTEARRGAQVRQESACNDCYEPQITLSGFNGGGGELYPVTPPAFNLDCTFI